MDEKDVEERQRQLATEFGAFGALQHTHSSVRAYQRKVDHHFDIEIAFRDKRDACAALKVKQGTYRIDFEWRRNQRGSDSTSEHPHTSRYPSQRFDPGARCSSTPSQRTVVPVGGSSSTSTASALADVSREAEPNTPPVDYDDEVDDACPHHQHHYEMHSHRNSPRSHRRDSPPALSPSRSPSPSPRSPSPVRSCAAGRRSRSPSYSPRSSGDGKRSRMTTVASSASSSVPLAAMPQVLPVAAAPQIASPSAPLGELQGRFRALQNTVATLALSELCACERQQVSQTIILATANRHFRAMGILEWGASDDQFLAWLEEVVKPIATTREVTWTLPRVPPPR